VNGQTFFTFPPDLEKSSGVGRPPPPDFFLRQIDFFSIFPSLYDPRQKNIIASLSCVPNADAHLLGDGRRRQRWRRDRRQQWWRGGADPPAQQPPPRLPRGGPAGEGRQLRQPPHPPPQGRCRRSAPRSPSAGTRVAPPRRAPGDDAGEGCVGAHPARGGARLRLDAPRRGGNGGGVGSAVGRGDGRGGGHLGDLPVS